MQTRYTDLKGWREMKSRLAEILGVEENEVFEFEYKKYRIHGGKRTYDGR